MWTQELKRKLDFKCSKLKLLKKKVVKNKYKNSVL